MYDKTAIRAGKVQIRRVFLKQWDPIGIGDDPDAQDEYDMYLSGMYVLLERDALEAEVVDYLHEIETERMGMAGDRARLLPIAKTLKSLKISPASAA